MHSTEEETLLSIGEAASKKSASKKKSSVDSDNGKTEKTTKKKSKKSKKSDSEKENISVVSYFSYQIHFMCFIKGNKNKPKNKKLHIIFTCFSYFSSRIFNCNFNIYCSFVSVDYFVLCYIDFSYIFFFCIF